MPCQNTEGGKKPKKPRKPRKLRKQGGENTEQAVQNQELNKIGEKANIQNSIQNLLNQSVGSITSGLTEQSTTGGKGRRTKRRSASPKRKISKKTGAVNIAPFVSALALLGTRIVNDKRFINSKNKANILGLGDIFGKSKTGSVKRSSRSRVVGGEEQEQQEQQQEQVQQEQVQEKQQEGGKRRRKPRAKSPPKKKSSKKPVKKTK